MEYIGIGLQKYFKNVGKIKRFSLNDEKILYKKYKETGCKESFNKIVNNNLRLVPLIAKRYRGHGLDFEDLINEGNIGLMYAVENYKDSKGMMLSSYIRMCVIGSVVKALADKSRTVRIPYDKHHHSVQAKQKGLSDSELESKNMYDVVNNTSCSLESAMHIPATEDTIEEKYIIKDQVIRAVNQLDSDYKTIIIYIYGLFGAPELNLEGLSTTMGMEIDKIKKLKLEALKRLRKILV